MPHYVVSSEGPLRVREVHRPDMPDWRPETGLPGVPDTGGPGGWPGLPRPPEGWERPELPPREEWPPLPPFLQPGVGLPIPPTVDLPWVPVPPNPEIPDPPDIWPPMPSPPQLPDLSGKTLILARFYVSRHVNFLRWVVIDHEEAKGRLQKAWEWIKNHPMFPAGGVGGRPPQRPEPGR